MTKRTANIVALLCLVPIVFGTAWLLTLFMYRIGREQFVCLFIIGLFVAAVAAVLVGKRK